MSNYLSLVWSTPIDIYVYISLFFTYMSSLVGFHLLWKEKWKTLEDKVLIGAFTVLVGFSWPAILSLLPIAAIVYLATLTHTQLLAFMRKPKNDEPD